MRISYSSLDTYQSCPLKYKFKAIDKIKEPKSKEAVFGSTIHDTMKFVHTPGILSPTLEQALEYFSNSWNPAVFDTPDEERAAFTQGVRIIEDYYRSNNPADFNIVNLESHFSIEIGEGANTHIVSGIIDRIDRTADGYEIIDYKTAKKMPTQERVETDLQLSIYLKAFLSYYPQEINNLDKIQVSLYFLKHGVKLTARKTKEQLQQTEQTFLDVIRLIEEKKFEPTVSPLCEWCGFQHMCPMWKHKFKELRKFDNEAINDRIQEYIELKSAMTITKERLGKIQEDIALYMQQEGVDRLFSESGVVSRTARKTFKYDTQRLRELLSPVGHWDDVVKVDGIALKAVMNVLPPHIRKDIEDAKVLDKESFTFSVKKSKNG
jgi:putative RecB family exonuclease